MKYTKNFSDISMAQKIHVMNVRLPDEVIKWLDKLVKSGIYNSRSEAIRDFLRDHLVETVIGEISDERLGVNN